MPLNNSGNNRAASLRLDLSQSRNPPAGETGGIELYSLRRGLQVPAAVTHTGDQFLLDSGFCHGQVVAVFPASAATAPTSLGMVGTSTGTITHNTPTTGSVLSVTRRSILTCGATAGNQAHWFAAGATFWQGNNTTDSVSCGFYGLFRFSWTDATSGQLFVGLRSAPAALAGDPSALTNLIGVGFDAADANLQLFNNDGTGTATKTNLGLPRTNPVLIDLYISAPPNGPAIQVEVLNRSANTSQFFDLTTDIPSGATFLGPAFLSRNSIGAGGQAAVHIARAMVRSSL